MKRVTMVKMGLVSFFGIVGMLNFAIPNHTFASGEQITTHEKTDVHKSLNLPIRRFTQELHNSVNNILEGILIGDFSYIKQQAKLISEKSEKIYVSFFENSNRFRKVEANPERDKQKKDFASYVEEINKHVVALNKAADEQDPSKAMNELNNILQHGCISCHENYRD